MKHLLIVLFFWTMFFNMDKEEWDMMIPPFQQIKINKMMTFYNQKYGYRCHQKYMGWGEYNGKMVFIIDCLLSNTGRRNEESL